MYTWHKNQSLKKIRSVNWKRLDVANPRTAPLVKMNKVLLGQYLDKYGNKLYDRDDFLFSQQSPNQKLSPQLMQMLDSHIDSMFKDSDMGISTPHPQFLF